MMTTLPLYFEDSYKFSEIAHIVSCQKDDQGHFITLDQTIFYPQGGGQPFDQGMLRGEEIDVPIHAVKKINQEIRHYTNQNYHQFVGQKVTCLIDAEKRILHTKLHTSGHLIACLIEQFYPGYKAFKGHHFPGECYVEFKGTGEAPDLDYINQKINELIEQDQPVTTSFETADHQFTTNNAFSTAQSLRWVRVSAFSAQACAGTHVARTSELQGLEITRIKAKNGFVKFSYNLKI